MKLDRMTPRSLIKIKSPRWKERTIGIASFRVQTHNTIEIEAKGKDGERYYPDTYYMRGEDIRTYPTQNISGVTLYLIPINDLEILED